jgi:hypothetical protein
MSDVHAPFHSRHTSFGSVPRASSPFTADATLLGALFEGVFENRYRLPISATATDVRALRYNSRFLAGTTAETVFLF